MPLKVAVVGAGAAGIIAAWNAARHGAEVQLLEKTPRIGTKILISGGGKCNITHDGPLEDLIRAFRPNEARFIRPSCYRFRNDEIVEMLTSRGLEVYTRPDGRIFPTNGTAKDVVRILATYLAEENVLVRLGTPVRGILVESAQAVGVTTDVGRELFDRVIVCVGGCSYPNSGTTGDGWQWARSLGHTIIDPAPALAPIDTDPKPTDGLPGVSLRVCVLKGRQNGKEIARWQGDTLFTHHGISGPTALGISRVVAERMIEGSVTLEADLCPSESFESLKEQLHEWIEANPRRRLTGFAEKTVPASLLPVVANQAGISMELVASQSDRKARNRLVEVIKGLELGRVSRVPIEKGEVTAGGVSLNEVDPHTMQSKLIGGLYLCGEVLDIAGPVGGYNLQAAFSGGFVAGESAAQ
ncbi:MAG: hypothetical protein HONBIEJF_02965 [Fimbriimonadaceae bacterium]|nr:hypothetical protein [Fimbriimonadaceae bacterium]